MVVVFFVTLTLHAHGFIHVSGLTDMATHVSGLTDMATHDDHPVCAHPSQARKESIGAISTVGLPALTHEGDMMGVWRNVLKVGETKKDSAELRKHFDDLASGSRRWFETDEELQARVAHLKARCKPRKTGGKATAAKKKKKKSSGRAPGTGSRSRAQKNYE